MNKCGEGYALINGGIIYQQGTSTEGSDNQWNNFTGANKETFVDGSSSSLSSVLWVQNIVPTFNPSFQGGSGTQYVQGPSPSIQIASGPTSSYNCGIVPPLNLVHSSSSMAARGGQNTVANANNPLTFMEKVVQDSIPYPAYAAQNTFINKNNVYRILKQDTTLQTASPILANFYSSNSNSSWALFCKAESFINAHNYTSANTLLNTFTPASTIEQNYKRFYQIYMHGMQGALTQNDTLDLETLGSSCPMLNGTVVFQARAFHNSYYNDYKHYEDNCPNADATASRVLSAQPASNNSSLLLSFFPNPTTGIINVSGSDGAAHSFYAEVYDISGKLILTNQLILENGTGKFKLDAENGIYMLYLYSKDGTNASVHKIIIAK
jgi:hypothetical protein